MQMTFRRVSAALFTLAFVLVACAGETGPQWTYAPVGSGEGQTAAPSEPGASEAPTATEAPASEAPASEAPASEAPGASAPPDQPGPTDGEARVIELEAAAAIQFRQDGQQIKSIDVTPGETVVFRIDNTAGFSHNFYIGTDDELQVMGGTTDTGLVAWNSGVQELEWTVPDDVTGLRFACTIPGHYYTMQGDFTVSS